MSLLSSVVVARLEKTAAFTSRATWWPMASRCHSLLAPTRSSSPRGGALEASPGTKSCGRMPWAWIPVRCLGTSVHPLSTRGTWAPSISRSWLSAVFPRQGGSIRFQTGKADGVNSVGDPPSHEKTRKPPKYQSMDAALDVFSDPYFYKNELYADNAEELRRDVLKDMTVGQVYRKFIKGHEKSPVHGCMHFADMISARGPSVSTFFSPATVTVEEALEDEKLIVLSRPQEVDLFKERVGKEIPTVDEIWKTTMEKPNSKDKRTRRLPLGLVLGPSGSGKTCFALQYLTNGFLNTQAKTMVSIYVHPASLRIDFKEDNLLAAIELINEVKRQCAIKIDKDIDERIDMHVCLIFDEAGSSHTKEWFECRNNLEALCTQASSLASSVAVVVVGTAITGRQLSSTEDAYFFRMRPWQAGDVAKLLEKEKPLLRLVEGETVSTVANAIFAHPKLSALAGNGRSAYYLVQDIAQLSKGCTRSSWEMQLDEWTPHLVTDVVRSYIGNNGLINLNTIQRRRVAAFVLHALHQLKKGDTTLPSFEGLMLSEKPVAASLLQYNLQGSNDKVEVQPGEDFAFTVTPAIAMILYSLIGIYATLVPGWKNEEEVAALYAARQLILRCMERYESDLKNGLTPKSCLKQLDDSLEKIRLLRLRTPLQSKSSRVSVPIVGGSTIMINGDNASFADIIAPYMLIQAKRTKEKTKKIELYDEMEKCGLLKENCDDRLLRGLLAVWKGTIDMEENVTPAYVSIPSQTKRNPQFSKAFPENLLSLVTPPHRIRFATIDGTAGECTTASMILDNGRSIALPVVDGNTITFVLSTNAERLNIKLMGGESPRVGVTITESNLNDDMEIDVETFLSDSDAKVAWTSFMQDKIRNGVKIKFLFTV